MATKMTTNKSCDKACSPSDWHKGGKCDLNGCYHEDGEEPHKETIETWRNRAQHFERELDAANREIVYLQSKLQSNPSEKETVSVEEMFDFIAWISQEGWAAIRREGYYAQFINDNNGEKSIKVVTELYELYKNRESLSP